MSHLLFVNSSNLFWFPCVTACVCHGYMPVCDSVVCMVCVCMLLHAYVHLGVAGGGGTGAGVRAEEKGPGCVWVGCPHPPVCSAPGAAPWGKRGWKMFHTLLRGMVLYFLKVGRVPTL